MDRATVDFRNEKILYVAKKHWVSAVKTVFWFPIISIPFLIPFIYAYYKNPYLSPIQNFTLSLTVALTLASLFILVYASLKSSILITNKRIVGIIDLYIKKYPYEIMLDNILSIDIIQNYLGKKLNYGTAIVKTDKGNDNFKIVDPVAFKNMIEFVKNNGLEWEFPQSQLPNKSN